MRACVACVGLIVLFGCFTIVIAPDDSPDPRQDLLATRFPTIVIDPGHGGNDEGAKSRGVLEKALTLELALRLRQTLHDRGYPTVMTREEDQYVSLPERVSVANEREGPEIFISLHFNQGSSASINGIETFYASIKTPPPPPKRWTWVGFFNRPDTLDYGENLAASIQSSLIAKTGARNRGIRGRDLYVTRHTSAPAVLIEGGFLTNTMESHLLGNDDYRNRLAEGIAEGVDNWCQSKPEPRHLPGPLAKAP